MNSIVYLTRRATFSASHRLHCPQLSPEENLAIFDKCNNANGHGHNYILYVTIRGTPDPITGIVINLHTLSSLIDEHVIAPFDHKHLNLDCPHFATLNPTVENIAIVIWELLTPHVPDLYEVKLCETERNTAIYRGEQS